MNTRLKYIDISKGILISMVVFLHVGWGLKALANGDNSIFKIFHSFSRYCYNSYFMAAFFILHGYCSHTIRSFKESFEYGCKTLIIPCFFLNLWHYHWFAVTMFGGILIHSLLREKSDAVKAVLYAAMFLLGLAIGHTSDNYFSISYILVYSPYIFLGEKLRFIVDNKLFGLISLIAYILIWLLYRYKFNIFLPSLSGSNFSVNFENSPAFIIASISGSSAIFLISRWLQNLNCVIDNLLVKLGKQSLVIYLFHFTLLSLTENLLVDYLNNADKLISLLAFAALFLFALFGSYFVGIAIEKYIPWLIGRNKFVM